MLAAARAASRSTPASPSRTSCCPRSRRSTFRPLAPAAPSIDPTAPRAAKPPSDTPPTAMSTRAPAVTRPAPAPAGRLGLDGTGKAPPARVGQNREVAFDEHDARLPRERAPVLEALRRPPPRAPAPRRGRAARPRPSTPPPPRGWRAPPGRPEPPRFRGRPVAGPRQSSPGPCPGPRPPRPRGPRARASSGHRRPFGSWRLPPSGVCQQRFCGYGHVAGRLVELRFRFELVECLADRTSTPSRDLPLPRVAPATAASIVPCPPQSPCRAERDAESRWNRSALSPARTERSASRAGGTGGSRRRACSMTNQPSGARQAADAASMAPTSGAS